MTLHDAIFPQNDTNTDTRRKERHFGRDVLLRRLVPSIGGAFTLGLADVMWQSTLRLRDENRDSPAYSSSLGLSSWLIRAFYPGHEKALLDVIVTGCLLCDVLFLLSLRDTMITYLIQQTLHPVKAPGPRRTSHILLVSVTLPLVSMTLYDAFMVESFVPPRRTTCTCRDSFILFPLYIFYRVSRALEWLLRDLLETEVWECGEACIGYDITSLDPIPFNVTGHFNDIFLGYHKTFGQVALRRPRISGDNYADAIRRFQREANAWNSLRHPCVLPLLGTFFRDEHVYFVSPFAESGNLLEYVTDRPQVNRIQLLCGVAHAIVYLHSQGIVHGDIKATNVLINREGCPLLCDFGLLKMPGTNTSIERKGAGSLRWQSSELWFDAPRSFASDTYAFAMTIVETLTGEVPFVYLNNDIAVIQAVVIHDERPSATPRASPTGLSYENAWAVAMSCWPKLPQDRIPMPEALRRLRADPSLVVDSGS